MNIIDLSKLELKTFTEQDTEDYCQINNINLLEITKLNLGWNELTDISVIKDLININNLWIHNTEIIDISVIQYLNNLQNLSIKDLKLESDQIQYINSLNNLKCLNCENGFKI